MAVPTTSEIGIPVTEITDESLVTAEDLIISSQVGQNVKYVPTPNGTDDT